MTTAHEQSELRSAWVLRVGGSVPAEALREWKQQLRDLMNRWRGKYSQAIREFAFLLRVDRDIHTYTKVWNIEGAQKAKRKSDWLEVEIGVPESWWRQNEGRDYKRFLAEAIEAGLQSMIELLQRNHHDVRANALLNDWEKVKSDYLTATALDKPEFEETEQMQKARGDYVTVSRCSCRLGKTKAPASNEVASLR